MFIQLDSKLTIDDHRLSNFAALHAFQQNLTGIKYLSNQWTASNQLSSK